MSDDNQPELPPFLRELFQQMGFPADGVNVQRMLQRKEPEMVTSALFAGAIEYDVDPMIADSTGLMIGVRRDLFTPETLNSIEKPDDKDPQHQGGGLLSSLFGGGISSGPVHMSVKRMAVRMTPEGPEIVDLDGGNIPDDLAQAMKAEQGGVGLNDTLEQAPRLLLKGEDPQAALTRATRIGLGLAAYRPVEGMLLRSDAQGNVAFSHSSDATDSLKAEDFTRYCHLQACTAAVLYDKTVDIEQPLAMGLFGKRILSGLTDVASLGTNVKVDVTLDRRVDFGLTWMKGWKVECHLPSDIEKQAMAMGGNIGDMPMENARILHDGEVVYTGPMTLGVVRDVLAPIIRTEAEKFLGKDCKWAENAGVLHYAVTFADSDADWVRMTVPLAAQGNAPQLSQ